MLEEILINLKVDYHWFFSALSQSLAALIAIAGMFIVYRLQVQMSDIREATRELQTYIKKKTNQDCFHMTIRETKNQAWHEIGVLREDIQKVEERIDTHREEERKGIASPEACKREVEKCKAEIETLNKKIDSYEVRIKEITNREDFEDEIKSTAYKTIRYFALLFLFSIICLISSKTLEVEAYKVVGNIVTVIISLFLIYGLRLFVHCCWLSLDIKKRV